MGNSPSALGIQLDQTAIYSGGTVTGKVFLRVTKETSCSSLQILFLGKEHSHVHWTTTRTTGTGDNKRTETVHHHAYANRMLVQIDVPLAEFPAGTVSPGNYEFPFSATVPQGLPTTMFAAGGGGDCSITYKLHARLHRPGMFKWDVKTTRSIMLQSTPLPPQPSPFYAPPQTMPVKLCCCLDRGKIHIGAGVDDTLLGRGQVVGIGIAVANESSQKLERIYVKIVEHVVWFAAGHRNHSMRTIAHTDFDTAQMAGLEELSKGTLKAARETAKSDGGAARLQTLEGLAATLLSGQQRENLSVSVDARDSYLGSCLRTTHRCYVTSKTPCCVTDPQLEVPVRIGTLPLPPPPTAVAEPVVPMGLAVAFPVPPPMVMAQPIPLDSEEAGAIRAVPLDWSGAVVAGTVVLPMGTAVVGGAALETDKGDDEEGAAPVVVQGTALLSEPGTMAGLKEQMDRSFDDHALLASLLGAPESAAVWAPLLQRLTPEEFGRIVGEVNLEFDQGKVASLLGRQLAGGVTAAHVLAAIGAAAENQPRAIVTALAPLCIDLQPNVDAIEARLSDWDRILCRSVLRPSGV